MNRRYDQAQKQQHKNMSHEILSRINESRVMKVRLNGYFNTPCNIGKA